MYSVILTVSYIVLLIAGIVYMSYLRIRSNRNYFYYTLSWYSLALIALILIRLLEIMSTEHNILRLYNQIDLIITAVLLPITINMLFTFIVKKMLPFIIQMVGGAAALALILFFWPFVSVITEQYRSSYSDAMFLIYVWFPAIMSILSVPLITFAIKNCYINISSLSIERVIAGSPDLYFYIDRFGNVTDHNATNDAFFAVRNRTELLDKLEKYSASRWQDGWPKLRQSLLLPEKKVTGEIRLLISDEELWYEWTVKPVRNIRDKVVGSFLLLSDRTAVKMYLNKLHQQNEDLQQVNNELADYEALVDRYTELAARQEVSDFIDVSVRYRILQSFDHIRSLQAQDNSYESSKLALEHLRSECKRALTDVRTLVKRLSQ